jgi:hypothetical protein
MLRKNIRFMRLFWKYLELASHGVGVAHLFTQEKMTGIGRWGKVCLINFDRMTLKVIGPTLRQTAIRLLAVDDDSSQLHQAQRYLWAPNQFGFCFWYFFLSLKQDVSKEAQPNISSNETTADFSPKEWVAQPNKI